jgi:hypothetical protein
MRKQPPPHPTLPVCRSLKFDCEDTFSTLLLKCKQRKRVLRSNRPSFTMHASSRRVSNFNLTAAVSDINDMAMMNMTPYLLVKTDKLSSPISPASSRMPSKTGLISRLNGGVAQPSESQQQLTAGGSVSILPPYHSIPKIDTNSNTCPLICCLHKRPVNLERASH